jgi:ATP-dependent DNA ligase
MARHRKTPLGFVAPMEARSVAVLPDEDGWQYEPKWDGFRCLAVCDGTTSRLYGKSGKELGRYFPEVVALLQGLGPARCVLDGELVIAIDGALSFDALQMRLHPAESRIRKLASATPAQYVVFDLLAESDGSLLGEPLRARRTRLERFMQRVATGARRKAVQPHVLIGSTARAANLWLSPATARQALAGKWLTRSEGSLDGIIAKRLEDPYGSGERAMLKYKRLRTADCVVGGFRYANASKQVGSLLLGLYGTDGKLNHVGFTSGIPASERAALTRKLLAIRKPPGFTGKAPGGPSRWSTERSAEWQPLAPKLVVEVSYDQVTGERFRHGTRLLRWRPDKLPRQCTMEQLQG